MLAGRPIMATLPASDLGRAKAFYRDVLGVSPTDDSDDNVAFYELGGTSLMLYQSEFAGTNQATAATWAVEGLEGIVGDLKAKGVEFQDFEGPDSPMVDNIITTPAGAKVAWFFDSERNIISLAEM